MTSANLNFPPATEDHLPLSSPMEDWTISQLLKVLFPDVRLRQRFRLLPYLEQVTLRQVLDSTLSLEHFLEQCGRQPQCGDLSVKRLRDVIEQTALAMSWREQDVGASHHTIYSKAISTPERMPLGEKQHQGGRINAL